MDENYYAHCIEIALSAIDTGNYIKAEKFLYKAKNISHTEEVDDLLEYCYSQMNNNNKKNLNSDNNHDGIKFRNNRINSNIENNENYKNNIEYTKEQYEIVQKIKKCKNYYDVLGIDKNATDQDIRKAYKKLALQLHPDKNHAPGSSEAFKAISNAVAILTDSKKRKEYDLFELHKNDNNNMRSYRNNYEYAYERGFESDISAEELFNIFFGNSFNDLNSTIFNQFQHQHYHHDINSTNFAFILILILIIISMLSSFFSYDPFDTFNQNAYVFTF